MKNLKKVLALVLAFACAFTMFASAADYTDQSSITHTDAVETLTTLGVLKGYDDGSFKPTGTITRAEMAKMIYTIRAGGNDDASGFANMTSSFTDINGHWAAGYIKYCQSMNIVAGKSATKFDPDGLVTVAETCKMALTVMGYTADKAGLIGSNWAAKTLALSSENDLLDAVTADFSGPCTRDNAAQILYNTIDAECVVWSNDKEDFVADSAGSNNTTQGVTVAEKWLNMSKVVGTLSSVTKDEGKDTYNLSITNVDTDASSKDYIQSFTKVAKDYTKYKNMKVKVLYSARDEVFGVYPLSDENTILEGSLGDFEKSDAKLKYDGNKYSVGATGADDTNLVKVDDDKTSLTNANNLVAFVDTYAKGLAKAFDAQAIDNDDTGKINLLTVSTFAVGKVTTIKTNGESITVQKKAQDSDFPYGSWTLDNDGANWPEDLAKDNYVAVYSDNATADGKYNVVKLDVVEGTISGTNGKATSAEDYKITIDGKEYEIAADNHAANDFEKLTLDATVKVVVKDGYVVWVDDANAGTTDVALCVTVAKQSGIDGKWQAKLFFPTDSTTQVVTLKEDHEWNDADADASGVLPAMSAFPRLVSYKRSGDDYKLTNVENTTDHLASHDFYEETTNNMIDNDKDELTGGTIPYIDDDAVVYVKYKSNDYIKITGKNFSQWNTSKQFDTKILADKAGTSYKAKVVYVDMKGANLPGSADTKTYAYISKNSLTTEDDTKYITYAAFTEDGNDVDLKVDYDAYGSVALPKGTVVEYTTNTDTGITTLINAYVPTSFTSPNGADTVQKYTAVGAITYSNWTSKDKTGTVELASGGPLTLDKDKDVAVLFVDTDDNSAATGTLSGLEADEDAAGVYINNCVYFSSADATIIVVDSQQAIKADIFGF